MSHLLPHAGMLEDIGLTHMPKIQSLSSRPKSQPFTAKCTKLGINA